MSIHSFLIILPIALVIGVGAVLRRAGFLDERAVVAVNRLVYWVAIPALLVRLTMKASPAMFADANLIIAGYVFFVIAPPIAWLIARTQSTDRRHVAVSVLVSIRANNVFMGLPAVSIALGAPGVEVVSVFFALSFVGYQILSISYGQLVLSGGLSLRSVVRTLERLLKSPFILACLFGIVLSAAGIHTFPRWLDEPLRILADMGTGLALLSLGASLMFRKLLGTMREMWADVLFKLIGCPALMLLCFYIWPTNRLVMDTVILLTAMPIAVNSFILAQGMGMDEEYAGRLIAMSTICSVVTIPFWIAVIGISA